MLLKIAAASVNQTPLDWRGNEERLQACLRRAKKESVDLLCCPELCISSYGCEDLFLTEEVLEKSWKMLQALAVQTQDLLFAVGLPLQHKDRRYNVLAIVENGAIVGLYAKQRLAREGVYYEPRWFDPWPEGVLDTFVRGALHCPIGEVMHNYKSCRIGFEICEDIWHEQRPARRYAAAGVDLILSAHASHFALGKHERRSKLVAASSANYDCVFIYANLLGNDAGRLLYDGDLMVAHEGKIVAAARRLSFKGQGWLCYEGGNNTRVDCFASEEEEFAAAAALALFDYLRKSRSKGFVLSASGGADSSMCAMLVSEMLRRALAEVDMQNLQATFPFLACEDMPPEALQRHLCSQLLTMVYQASDNSSETTFEAARSLAEDLGAHFLHWSIADEVRQYTQKVATALNRPLSWAEDDIALQNIQARARTPALWLLTNVLGALLLTTSNRSEGSVGYATMDGDTAGSLAPLASVPKVFILRWLRWAEQTLPCPGLRAVNKLQPTAELRPAAAAQSDEADLMPYDLLEAIEQEAILHRQSPQQVLQTLLAQNIAPEATLRAYVKKFFRLWAQNQWKRERIAPAFHLGAYSIDPRAWYRFPILSAAYTEELAAL